MDGPYKDLRVIKHQTQERKHQRSDKSDIQNEYIKMKEMRHHKSDSSWPCWPHLNTAFFVTQQLIYFLSIGHETGTFVSEESVKNNEFAEKLASRAPSFLTHHKYASAGPRLQRLKQILQQLDYNELLIGFHIKFCFPQN